MSDLININDFFNLNKEIPVVDVRSPAEFERGHIPGAINIPLFDNEERAAVGSLYKNTGQKDAVLAGLEMAGKKLRRLVESGIKTSINGQLILHCWRGGMRSASIAWLYETCGIRCFVLKGGYKSYRQFIREYFLLPFNLLVIGGMTGSGKSAILEEIANSSFQVLKLEELAHHKGSAFGSLGEKPQNTNEQFENDIFMSLHGFDINKPIFVEDESRNIGRNIIPPEFFKKITISRLIVANMDKDLRVCRLVKDYGGFKQQELKNCIEKISKKLGGQKARLAMASLDEGKPEIAAEICLYYYDKAYNFGLLRKKSFEVISIRMESADSKTNANTIIKVLREKSIL
jgi:tRNA 2-selenouridine synthase